MNEQVLKERLTTFMSELGVPTTAFAKRVDMSASAVVHWLRGEQKMSEKRLQIIDEYLTKYGF